tara:strand:+ start:3290 stop:3400 length:111 start_codon:yes stop_codon:yes gene_type:complete
LGRNKKKWGGYKLKEKKRANNIRKRKKRKITHGKKR